MVTVSRNVLNATAQYMQWKEAQAAANRQEDLLNAMVPHLTGAEAQAYSHIIQMYEIGADAARQHPEPFAPYPPLQPDALDATAVDTRLSLG